jgi:hypothetical protein
MPAITNAQMAVYMVKAFFSSVPPITP